MGFNTEALKNVIESNFFFAEVVRDKTVVIIGMVLIIVSTKIM